MDLSIFECYADGTGEAPAEEAQWFLLTDCVVRQGERARYCRLTLWPTSESSTDGAVYTTVNEEYWPALEPFVKQLTEARQGIGSSPLVPVFRGRDGKWKFSHVVAAHGSTSTMSPVTGPDEELVRIQTYVPTDLRDQYRRVAAQRGLDLAEFVRQALHQFTQAA